MVFIMIALIALDCLFLSHPSKCRSAHLMGKTKYAPGFHAN